MSHKDMQCESEHQTFSDSPYSYYFKVDTMFMLYINVLTKHYTVINPIL